MLLITSGLDNNECIDVVYLYFAKAFDKVPHERLLDKVNKHVIGGRVWLWIKEWLGVWKQRVCINGRCSNWISVTSGVPQGSVLGPSLFLIFINDLDSDLLSSLLKFADDTKVFTRVNDEKDKEELQADLDCLTEWSEKWQSPFNASKCRVMHLGRSNKKFDYSMGWEITSWKWQMKKRTWAVSCLAIWSQLNSVSKLMPKPVEPLEWFIGQYRSKLLLSWYDYISH